MRHFFSAALLFLCAFTCNAGNDTFTSNGFTCSIIDGPSIQISKYSGDGASFAIPTSLEYKGKSYPVTELICEQTGTNPCVIPSDCNVTDIIIPASIKKLTGVTRNNTYLKTAIIENGDNLTQCSQAFGFDNYTSDFDYLIVFNNKDGLDSGDLNGCNTTYKGCKFTLKFFNQDNEETIKMYFLQSSKTVVFNDTKFDQFLSALERRGTDINTISEISISNYKCISSKDNQTSFVFKSNPANKLALGAKVIASETTYTSTNIPDMVNFTAPSSDAAGTIHYSRSNTKDWNSVCLPFDIKEFDFTKGENKIYTLKSATDNTVTLSRIAEGETVPAGTPCFIHSTEDSWNLNITTTISSQVSAQTVSVNGMNLVGSFTQETIGANKYKLTADGAAFGVTTSENATVAPFRCYITTTENNAPARLSVNLDEETSITIIPDDAAPAEVKLYDLMGRPRKEGTPGIFIKSTR